MRIWNRSTRLGSLAILGIGIGICPLIAGLDGPHIHAGDTLPRAHRHLHAGHHSHDHASSGGPTAPERREESGSSEQGDTVLSLHSGGPLLPDAVVPRIEQRADARPPIPLPRAPRLAVLESHLGPRAPPA